MKTEDAFSRYQHCIDNQVQSINRLLEGDATYDAEMAALHQELAEVQTERDSLLEELERSKAGG